MSKTINSTYFPDENYIAVFVKGLVNSTTVAKEVVEYGLAKMQQNNCIRVYFDVSETLSSATTAENFELAQSIRELIKLPLFRWAVYYKNDSQMYEMIANLIKQIEPNNLLICNDSARAKHWLLEEEPKFGL